MKKNFLLKLPPRCQPIWTIHIPFKSPHWIQKLLHIFTERNFTMCPCSNATTYSNITPCYVAWQRVKTPSQVLYIWNLWVKGFQTVYGLSKTLDVLEEALTLPSVKLQLKEFPIQHLSVHRVLLHIELYTLVKQNFFRTTNEAFYCELISIDFHCIHQFL